MIAVEDKLSHKSLKRKRSDQDDELSTASGEDFTSESESEDDAGELATEALDSEIFATLNAIRSKDPRVYDKQTTFYSKTDEVTSEQPNGNASNKEKPMFLRDYHRQNLLNSVTNDQEESHETPLTYNQEQDALKRSIVGEINAATAEGSASSSDDGESGRGDDGFLVPKPRRKDERIERTQLDVENADKDPEAFLSNFMAARAWVPSERTQFQPLESDDEEQDRKADEFEEAYNFRFEDPSKSNEKLVSHARDIAAKYSVRREEPNPRKRQRESEGERKEAAKRERVEEKARLRKLKIEEAEEKLRKIKKAAGLRGSGGLSPEDWARFLDDDWSNEKWEEDMQKRFGEAYYAQDDDSSDENGHASTKKRRKPKKPRWEDDIDIKDLVPDFDEQIPTFELSDEERDKAETLPSGTSGQSKSTLNAKQGHQNKQREALKDRRIIEQLVDDRLELDVALTKQGNSGGFHYRETSPQSYGLSNQEILTAPDSQLNAYVGLKKLASFRDPSKKRKDQKHLGKKARLRQWRKETFGNEEGPKFSEMTVSKADGNTVGVREAHDEDDGAGGVDIRAGPAKKKRRRGKRSKWEQDVST